MSACVLFENKNTSESVNDGVNVDYLNEKADKFSVCVNEEGVSNGYQKMVGFDPGYKNWLASVAIDLEAGEEINIKVTSKASHAATGKRKRQRKAKRWTRVFGRWTANDRENHELYQEMLSPGTIYWID